MQRRLEARTIAPATGYVAVYVVEESHRCALGAPHPARSPRCDCQRGERAVPCRQTDRKAIRLNPKGAIR